MSDSHITHESVWDRPGTGHGLPDRVTMDDGSSHSFDWVSPPSQWNYIPTAYQRPRHKWNCKNKGAK